ncbi:hypothetical protein F444_01437, partial [Phytophthora nicotianae P1976]
VHKNLNLGARSWDTAILDQQATATSSWNELHSVGTSRRKKEAGN